MKKILYSTLLVVSHFRSYGKDTTGMVSRNEYQNLMLQVQKDSVAIANLHNFKDEYLKKHETALVVIEYWWGLLVIITGLGVWTFIVNPKKLEEKIVMGQTSSFTALIEKYNIEKTIQENTKILLVSSIKTENSQIQKLLRDGKVSFKQLITKQINKIEEIDSKDFELIIFNDLDGKLGADSIADYLRNNTAKIKYFYLGNSNIASDIMVSHMIGSARFQSQIVGNIMNLLKYN